MSKEAVKKCRNAQKNISDTNWLDVPGAPKYQANCCGVIRSVDRIILTKRKGQPEYKCFRKGQILKQSNNGRGYLFVGLGRGRKEYVHRIVAMTFLPNPDNLPEVNHKDFNTANNHYSNLEWVNRSDNRKHSYKHGRCALPKNTCGERNGNARLSESDVIEIRALKGKEEVKKLAERFGVTKYHIYNLQRGIKWKYLY